VSISQKPGCFSSHAQNLRTGIWFLRRVPFLVVLFPFILCFFRSAVSSRSTVERLMVASFFFTLALILKRFLRLMASRFARNSGTSRSPQIYLKNFQSSMSARATSSS
jgi:hypothetical protein